MWIVLCNNGKREWIYEGKLFPSVRSALHAAVKIPEDCDPAIFSIRDLADVDHREIKEDWRPKLNPKSVKSSSDQVTE